LAVPTWTAEAQVSARLFRYPDVSDKHIVFAYGGDLWVVNKEGGTANKLSSPSGAEGFARFSPDGSKIAFSGNYDGNYDIYVIPTLGGLPTRITYHGMADRLTDWFRMDRICCIPLREKVASNASLNFIKLTLQVVFLSNCH
jgi:tricorn protease-like protein